MAEGRQRVERGTYFEINAPAAPAVTTIGSAAWDIFLTVEMNHPIAALAGFHFDFCLIYEHK
jgi:hypothetical protein